MQAKMMTICDIFDALSASDRPYKRAVPTDRALEILKLCVRDEEIDSELFRLFLDAQVYRLVAKAPAVDTRESQYFCGDYCLACLAGLGPRANTRGLALTVNAGHDMWIFLPWARFSRCFPRVGAKRCRSISLCRGIPLRFSAAWPNP